MTTDLHQLTGAYVLDSLDDLERRAFERHLAECEDCRTEVRELSETVAELGAGDAIAPPEGLRDSVMAEVSRTVQLAPHPRTAPVSAAGRRWASWLTVAAVAVLAFGLGAFVTQQRSQPAPLAQEPGRCHRHRPGRPTGSDAAAGRRPLDRDRVSRTGTCRRVRRRTRRTRGRSRLPAVGSGHRREGDQCRCLPAGPGRSRAGRDRRFVRGHRGHRHHRGARRRIPQPTSDPIGVAPLA
jgi:hypothetical protein